MQLGDNSDRFGWFIQFATLVLVVAVLHFAQDVLLPVAFAVLLAFLLSPLVVRLMRWGLPKTMAIVATVIVAFSVLGAMGWMVTTQAISLLRELPNYEQNIRQKITALKRPNTPGAVTRIAGMIENLRKEIQAPDPATPASGETAATKPVPVEVRAVETTPLEFAREIVSPILGPLGVAGIVIVFVVAILFQREDLRDRFIKLVSAGEINIAIQAVDDAAQRVSRYLGMQLVVNATYGIPVGIGLHLIGIPNAALWGLLSTLLRFIPFVGPWIAAAFPLLLSVAVDPGWNMLLYCLALFIVMEIVSNNIVEVVLYGASTGISNFALLVAAVFWTWLWGPAGLVLSTPLTVCLLVIGTYVPGFKILSMLLGSEPVLEPPAQFYRRMRSMESEDMLGLATKFVEERSLDEFYDEVFLPALIMSEHDRHSGLLAEDRQRFIFQSSRDLIDELERQDESAKLKTGDGLTAVPLPAAPTVLVVPARDDADEISAQLLAHLLRRRGIVTAVAQLGVPPAEIASSISRHAVQAVVISALPPSAVAGARQMWRRLTARCPNVPVIVGIWRHETTLNDLGNRLHVPRPEEVVTSLPRAIEQIEKILQPPATGPGDFPPAPAAKKTSPTRPPVEQAEIAAK